MERNRRSIPKPWKQKQKGRKPFKCIHLANSGCWTLIPAIRRWPSKIHAIMGKHLLDSDREGVKLYVKYFLLEEKAAQDDSAPLASNGFSHCNPCRAIPGHSTAHTWRGKMLWHLEIFTIIWNLLQLNNWDRASHCHSLPRANRPGKGTAEMWSSVLNSAKPSMQVSG